MHVQVEKTEHIQARRWKAASVLKVEKETTLVWEKVQLENWPRRTLKVSVSRKQIWKGLKSMLRYLNCISRVFSRVRLGGEQNHLKNNFCGKLEKKGFLFLLILQLAILKYFQIGSWSVLKGGPLSPLLGCCSKNSESGSSTAFPSPFQWQNWEGQVSRARRTSEESLWQ